MKSPICFFGALMIGFGIVAPDPPARTYALDVERVFGSQTQTIRREASAKQGEVAEANARAYMAKLRTRGSAAPSKSGGADGKTGTTKNKTAPQNAQAALAKRPRFVAVDTVKDERSVPGTKKDVMIWDTHSASLVDNNVYDVSNVPPVGTLEKFETHSVQYVGNGSVLPEIAERPPKQPTRNGLTCRTPFLAFLLSLYAFGLRLCRAGSSQCEPSNSSHSAQIFTRPNRENFDVR